MTVGGHPPFQRAARLQLILKKIGPGLAADLPLYSMGLFALFPAASLQVRPRLLDLYAEHYLPLKRAGLAPCIDGLVVSLLYGLEEENTKSRAVARDTFSSS